MRWFDVNKWPGIFKPKRSLESRIVKNAWSAFSGVDLFCIVVDPRYKIDDPLRDIIKKSGQSFRQPHFTAFF